MKVGNENIDTSDDAVRTAVHGLIAYVNKRDHDRYSYFDREDSSFQEEDEAYIGEWIRQSDEAARGVPVALFLLVQVEEQYRRGHHGDSFVEYPFSSIADIVKGPYSYGHSSDDHDASDDIGLSASIYATLSMNPAAAYGWPLALLPYCLVIMRRLLLFCLKNNIDIKSNWIHYDNPIITFLRCHQEDVDAIVANDNSWLCAILREDVKIESFTRLSAALSRVGIHSHQIFHWLCSAIIYWFADCHDMDGIRCASFINILGAVCAKHEYDRRRVLTAFMLTWGSFTKTGDSDTHMGNYFVSMMDVGYADRRLGCAMLYCGYILDVMLHDQHIHDALPSHYAGDGVTIFKFSDFIVGNWNQIGRVPTDFLAEDLLAMLPSSADLQGA